MPQIALIPHQHDHNICVRMVSQLFQPSLHILVGLVLADIVHEQCSHSTSIVRRRDSTVAFLPCRIPNLGLDGLGINLNRSGRKLDANRRFAIQVEFIAGES